MTLVQLIGIISGSISIIAFIYTIYRFLWLRHIYYNNKDKAQEIIGQMEKIVDRICSEENIPPIECILEPFMTYEPDCVAAFDRKEVKIFITPTIGYRYYDLVKPVRDRIILEIAAHELCHYIQYLKLSILTKKQKEEEAQKIGKIYTLHNLKRFASI